MPSSINTSLNDVQKQTEQLKKAMTDLNRILSDLADVQDELGKRIEKNNKKFNNMAESVDDVTHALKDFNKQINDNAKTIDLSKKSLEENKKVLSGLQQTYDTLSRSYNESSTQLKALNDDNDLLTKNIKDQEDAIAESTETFDYHKAVIDQLTSASDKLKAANEDAGPVIDDLTEGFNMMKDGLDLVKTGFTGVGGALKATGFGLFVFVLQSVVEYFTKTTEGAKRLKGGIAAISLVIKTVKDAISNMLSGAGKNIVDAFIHPAETIKKIWGAVIENIASRFKGIQVFFKGLFSGDVKAMGNGVIQMGTGVTNGIDKITSAVKTAQTNIKKLGTDMKKAYNDGANASDNATKKLKANGKKTGKIPSKTTGRTRYPQLTELHTPNVNIQTSISQKDQGDGSSSSNKDTNIQLKTVQIIPEASLADAIFIANSKGDWQTEFELRQVQLNAERKQAEDAAIARNQSTLKIGVEFEQKQKQLDKARLDAQAEGNKSYLVSVDKLSNAVTSIFGKNTIAARLAFKAHQAAAAGQVIIDTKRSIMGIWASNASLPFIGVAKAIAETAIVTAAGASSLASIIKQKPGFARGGQYVSDGRGTLLSGYSRTDDTNAYLRSGEAVVVSEAMRNPWARNLVSAINVAHGGRDFSVSNPGRGYAIGGIFTDGGNANRYYNQPVNDSKELANTLAYQMLNNFPPIYVDVKDVNNQQNILAQTVNRVNL